MFTIKLIIFLEIMTVRRDKFIMLFIMLDISGKLVINNVDETIVFTYQD